MPTTAQPTDPRHLLTVHEAAAEARLSLRTMRRHIAAGRLPVVRLGARVLIDRAALDSWLVAETQPATTGPLAGRRS